MALHIRKIIFPFARNTTLRSLRYFASENAKIDPNSALKLTDSCVKRLREICIDGSFLRVSVDGGGCSGFQYKFDFDTKLNNDDIVFGPKEARVVIDNVSLDYCAGTTLDYKEELIRAGFVMEGNPKAEEGCSCGASFSIKID
ncbi:iron-sulfur cluster assembly 2 homolog, mitochondrial [Phlebotomus papatasi]|uniref:iron-sulfur cluster assembly 2 homolog, mitochondrial n=1 Tax=Phlebotomus papatasi TaxID=29031 RepID=UPI0024844135|nr:iron-sulfur cluster assembly 2 homolog, mitochondrial [Phlebotomus papatasi]